MSILRRLWRSIINPSRYVGRDLEGNRFYEHPSSSEDPRRTKRTVRYSHPDDVWHYIGGGRRLPIQWTAWLTHTRRKPPTLDELKADIIRQHRVLANVALIEARDRNERRGPTTAIQSGNAPQDQGHTTNSASSTPQSTSTSPQQNRMSTVSLPKMATEVSEPQSWTPRAHVRESNK